MDELTRKVKRFARQVGADLVGIAGKECFGRLPSVRPDELLSDAQSVVVMAVRRNPHAYGGPSWNAQEHYVGLLALEMHVLLRTSGFLEDKGFETVPVSHHGSFTPHGSVYVPEAIKQLTVTPEGELQGAEEFKKEFYERIRALSHMKLAEEAGLGEIGHCKLLVTPQFGPRVGLVSLVTDAPLEPDSRLEEPACLKDDKCVEICPAGALTPEGGNLAKCMFQMGSLPHIDLIRRRDEEAIERYLHAGRVMVFPFEKGILQRRPGGCGLCVRACPVGRRQKIPK